MSHVDGSDDGVGYGVFGESNSGGQGVKGHSQIGTGVLGDSAEHFGVNGSSQSSAGVAGEQPRRLWCVWHERATALVCIARTLMIMTMLRPKRESANNR